MAELKINAVIKIRDGNPYILINPDQVIMLHSNWKKPMPVIIKVNGQPDAGWHINMMPVGDGSFYLYLHGDVRKASNTKVGDRVDVELLFDEKYKNGPQHPMPVWFSDSLKDHPIAHQSWINLSPSRQKEILRYFSWLKSDEAIQRNLSQVIKVLSGENSRFMARDWKDGK